MSLNQTQIIGNLGRDPEVKTFDDGNQVANISVATTEKWKGKDGEPKEHTEWHRVVLRGPLAGIAERFLSKGSKVFIQGKNKTRQYEKDGVTHYVTEIECAGPRAVMQMLDSKGGGETAAPAPAQSQGGQRSAYAGGGAVEDDEVPF